MLIGRLTGCKRFAFVAGNDGAATQLLCPSGWSLCPSRGNFRQKTLRVKTDFSNRINAIGRPRPVRRKISLASTQRRTICLGILSHHEGRFADVTDAGRVAVGRGGSARRALLKRTAKLCGSDTPMLVSSSR